MSQDNLPIIDAKGVSKRFLLQTSTISLRQEAIQYLWSMVRGRGMHAYEPFYALKDVTFSIYRGESVGIVGHNGAGKTTLLRILAGIMAPSGGYVTVRGSYVSLIGLGAGFSETMSGRKNIYLNAAIHGINPQQIEEHVQDIIAFADIGKYIDMPVKDYSSGMRSRLGFSIAMHILPDIVFLDEILSVGDTAFKKKSERRLADLLSQNRTIIFVSHASSAVVDVCSRALWLHQGQLQMDDAASDVVKEYEAYMRLNG